MRKRYFDLSEIYSSKCVNKLWICSRRARLARRWLHARHAAFLRTNLKSLQGMSASDVLWPLPTSILFAILQDILHQFYVLSSSSRGCSRRCCCWCCGVMARVGEDKQSLSLEIAPLTSSSTQPFAFLVFSVLLEREKYDALCMLTTQHFVLHFTASSWNDMPPQERRKFKFIGFIKVWFVGLVSYMTKLWFMVANEFIGVNRRCGDRKLGWN